MRYTVCFVILYILMHLSWTCELRTCLYMCLRVFVYTWCSCIDDGTTKRTTTTLDNTRFQESTDIRQKQGSSLRSTHEFFNHTWSHELPSQVLQGGISTEFVSLPNHRSWPSLNIEKEKHKPFTLPMSDKLFVSIQNTEISVCILVDSRNIFCRKLDTVNFSFLSHSSLYLLVRLTSFCFPSLCARRSQCKY